MKDAHEPKKVHACMCRFTWFHHKKNNTSQRFLIHLANPKQPQKPKEIKHLKKRHKKQQTMQALFGCLFSCFIRSSWVNAAQIPGISLRPFSLPRLVGTLRRGRFAWAVRVGDGGRSRRKRGRRRDVVRRG